MLAPLRVLLSLLCLPRSSPNLSRLALGLILLCLLASPALAQGEFTVRFDRLEYNVASDAFIFRVAVANEPGAASAVCRINGGDTNCSPGHIGTLGLNGKTGIWTFDAEATVRLAGASAVSPLRIFVISADPPANTLGTPKWFSIFEDSAKVEWAKPADATGYEVRVRKCGGEPRTCEAAQTLTPGDVAEASLKDASNCCTVNTEYETSIRATNASSNSAWADWTSFTYTDWPPLGFSIDASTAIFSWDEKAGVRGYALEFQHGTDGRVHETSTLAFNVSTKDLKTETNDCCLNGETYRGRIRTTVSGPSPWTYSKYSSWVSFTFAGTSTVPAIPTGLAITRKGVASWTAITGAIGTGYRVNVQAGTEGDVNTYSVNGLSNTSLNLRSGALPGNQTRLCCAQGETYRVRIEGYHDHNIKTPPSISKFSPVSPWVTFTFDGRPDPPASLVFDEDEGEATWVKVGDANSYRIQLREVRGGQPGQSVLLDLADVDTVNFNDAPEATICCYNSAVYQARILARNSFGDSAFSQWFDFTYIGISSIERPEFIPARSSDAGGSGDSSGSSRAEPDTTTRDPANLPIPAQDHSNLPAGAEVHSETPWIQFNEVRGAGIGVRSILDRGARQAIDVWGPMGVEAEICFDGVGSLLLLDAAYAPRLETPLVSYLRLDGKTCAQLDRAGTVVLMPGEPTHVVVPTATPPAPALVSGGAPVVTADGLIVDDPTTAVALANCHVGSFHVLNLRERPAGRILGWFHGDMTRALARTPNWFQIEYNGMVGWVSGHYAIVNGDCG